MSLLPLLVKRRQMSGCCATALMTWACQCSGSAAQSTHCVCCLFRVNKVGHLYYSKWEQRIYMIWAYILVASVIVFGRVLLLTHPYCFLCTVVHPCMAHAQLLKRQLL